MTSSSESARSPRANAEGTLGLDFLNRFELIQFHVPTLRLTLT